MTTFADGDASPSLLYTDGADSGVTFQVGNKTYSGGSGLFTSGQAVAVGPYPASAVEDGMRIDTGVPGIELKVNGLAAPYALGYRTAELRFFGNTGDTTATHRASITWNNTGSYDAAGNQTYANAAVLTDTLGAATTSATIQVTTPDTSSVISVLEIVFN